jgi:hypothetical protein
MSTASFYRERIIQGDVILPSSRPLAPPPDYRQGIHDQTSTAANTDSLEAILRQRIRAFLQRFDEGTRTVIIRLMSLVQDEEVEGWSLRPTEHAFTTAFTLVILASPRLERGFPRGAVSTDSEGGIRVEWNRRPRRVRLVIPATSDRHNYIYHEEDDQYATDGDVSPDRLSHWLRWLTEHEDTSRGTGTGTGGPGVTL